MLLTWAVGNQSKRSMSVVGRCTSGRFRPRARLLTPPHQPPPQDLLQQQDRSLECFRPLNKGGIAAQSHAKRNIKREEGSVMDHRRKAFMFIVGLAVLLVTTSPNAFDSINQSMSLQQSPRQIVDAADETAINALRQQMVDGWNWGSGAAFAEVFTEDADFVAFDGTRLRGRQEIASTYQRLFDGVMNGSRLTGQLKS